MNSFTWSFRTFNVQTFLHLVIFVRGCDVEAVEFANAYSCVYDDFQMLRILSD